MFFVQGRVEMILRDVREGFRSRIMHFFIDGDNHRGPNNVAVVIPPGVAHALRVEGSEDASWFTARARILNRRSKAGLRATWNRRCCRKAGGVFWRNK
jgi:dTDP-4-dehydrorhamnose 3,5-epimerase-like enzyme